MEYTDNLYRTLDGGTTWNTIDVDSVEHVRDFYFSNADDGHILGAVMSVNEYKLLVTDDGAQNCTLEYTTGWNFYGGGVVLNPLAYELRDWRIAGVTTWRRAVPLHRTSKLSVHIVTALRDKQVERDERLPKNLLCQNAFENRVSFHVDVRLRRRI